MDGIHDLGGQHGFGAVHSASGEHAAKDWETRMLHMVNAAFTAGLIGNIDQFRHAIERIDPAAYLTDGYYGRWLGALETLLVEKGVVRTSELNDMVNKLGGEVARIAARPANVPEPVVYPPGGWGGQRPLPVGPLFQPGQRVRTLADGTSGHTRLPRYARGREGVVFAWHEGWVYPDTNAHGLGEQPQHLYTVCFDAAVLWGAAAEPATKVHLDLFEPYLRPA
jgi:nitrile hydratase